MPAGCSHPRQRLRGCRGFNIKKYHDRVTFLICTEAPCLDLAHQIDALPTTTGGSPVRTPEGAAVALVRAIIVESQNQHGTLDSEVLKIHLKPRTSSASHLHNCLTPRDVMRTVQYRWGLNQRERTLFTARVRSPWESNSSCGTPGPYSPNASAMAVSPNSATRSRSSSAATPDGLFEEATDSTGCTHISALLADSAESDPQLKRYRSVVTWKAQRTHDALHSAKRRKVRFIYTLLYPIYTQICGQVALPTCGTCGVVTPRPFVCLDCAFSGCWQGDHIVDHLKDENHRFCAST
jgi:hypothetical protein